MTFQALVDAADAIRAGSARRHAWLRDRRLVGIGWATVELDRAERELGAGLKGPAWTPIWTPAPRDALLGASARRSMPSPPEDPIILLLEPDTEGRLAASLVRFGEGVAAIYLALAASGSKEPPLSLVSPPAPSPLGAARVLIGGPAWGPHVVILEGDAA